MTAENELLKSSTLKEIVIFINAIYTNTIILPVFQTGE